MMRYRATFIVKTWACFFLGYRRRQALIRDNARTMTESDADAGQKIRHYFIFMILVI